MKSFSYLTAAVLPFHLTQAVRSNLAATCCNALSSDSLLEGKVYYPNTTSYENRLGTYWSASAALHPWCMVMPETAEDASQIMKSITAHQCPFGIKGGGHGTFALSNGVEKGITIDFGYMNSTTYDAETGLASIGPGGHWGPVYDTLAEYGVLVTGGRASTVGVGGFISGGGNSFHSGMHGFGCDNVENFEVVLADGSIVNANADENRDLWVALRGSNGNMGLITRFDMAAIEYAQPEDPKIFGGLVNYDPSVSDQVVDAYAAFAENVPADPHSSVLIWWTYDTTLGGMSLSACLDNSANVIDPPAMDGFLGIEGIVSNTLRSAPLTNITGELETVVGVYNIWMTAAYRNDPRVMRYAGRKHEELVHAVEDVLSEGAYISTMCQFQPLTKTMIDHGEGNNVMGLDVRVSDAEPVGAMFLMYFAVGTAEDEAVAQGFVRDFMDDLDAYATSLDSNWDWQYINYAGRDQDPIATFGESAITKLREASSRYDPDGVFQKLRGSGFKIPDM